MKTLNGTLLVAANSVSAFQLYLKLIYCHLVYLFIVIQFTYTSLTRDINGTLRFTGGYEVELLNSMKQYFNFQYKIVDCKQVWGNYINGTWTGLIGKVFDNVNNRCLINE